MALDLAEGVRPQAPGMTPTDINAYVEEARRRGAIPNSWQA